MMPIHAKQPHKPCQFKPEKKKIMKRMNIFNVFNVLELFSLCLALCGLENLIRSLLESLDYASLFVSNTRYTDIHYY